MVNKIVIGAFSRQRYAIFCIYAKNHSPKASEETEKSRSGMLQAFSSLFH